MAEYSVRRRSDSKPRSEKTFAANAYPKGSVPDETGWFGTEQSVSKPPGHNKITVCRGRAGFKHHRE